MRSCCGARIRRRRSPSGNTIGFACVVAVVHLSPHAEGQRDVERRHSHVPWGVYCSITRESKLREDPQPISL